MTERDSIAKVDPRGFARWWVYQRERFPIFQHGLLVAAFSSCAVSFSALLSEERPQLVAYGVAFLTCFLFFLQLRIADEFKDAKEDAEFRPYRAVPRGLVKLRELGLLFVISAVLQLVSALFLEPRLLWVLAVAWTYLGLMSVEFFARDWLKARPITYLWTHMLIMPIVDFYATACHWLPADSRPGRGLGFFLVASFCNGLVIELGRKLRQPSAEEEGVPTYSKLWGLQRAAVVWWCCVLATGFFAVLAARTIDSAVTVAWVLGPSSLICGVSVIKWRSTESSRFELLSGLWTLLLYLSLGLIPLLLTR